MCPIAASRSGTTAARDLEREVLGRVVLVGGGHHARRTPANAWSPCTVTPASCRAGTTRGRNASATSACTSSDSAALQTEVRWVLALSTIASAMSRSAVGVDVHVAVADAGLDHRHRRLLDHRPDQAGAAARDEHVDQAAGPHQRLGRLVPRPRARAGPRRPGRPDATAAARRVCHHRGVACDGRSRTRAAARRCRSSGRCRRRRR